MPIREESNPHLPAVVSRSYFITRARLPLFALVILGLLAGSSSRAFAQDAPKPQPDTSKPLSNAPSSARPLSQGGKFQLFVVNSIYPTTIAYAAVASAVSQADNSPTGWGQGWDAYGKRFGSSMARQASGEFFGTFILASALHQDPRFYPQTDPTFGQAIKYSARRVFITRNDDGHEVANWSGLLGPAMAEGLANAYWPEQNRTAGDTLMRYGLDLAARAGGYMLRDYWPVVRRKVHH